MNNTIPFHSAPHAPQITVDVNILSMLKQAASRLSEMASENGYHAKTYIRCLIGSILIECSSIFVVRNAPMEWLILIIVLSNLMVLKVAPVNNKQIHLTAGEMNAMKKEIRKILIGMDILCLLCVFCYPASDMGKGLVAALAADAITLVAADLYKAKER